MSSPFRSRKGHPRGEYQTMGLRGSFKWTPTRATKTRRRSLHLTPRRKIPASVTPRKPRANSISTGSRVHVPPFSSPPFRPSVPLSLSLNQQALASPSTESKRKKKNYPTNDLEVEPGRDTTDEMGFGSGVVIPEFKPSLSQQNLLGDSRRESIFKRIHRRLRGGGGGNSIVVQPTFPKLRNVLEDMQHAGLKAKFYDFLSLKAHCPEQWRFYEAVRGYERIHAALNPSSGTQGEEFSCPQLWQCARLVWETYIQSETAQLQVNLSSEVYLRLKDYFKEHLQQEGSPSADVFDESKQCVARDMEIRFDSEFRKSAVDTTGEPVIGVKLNDCTR